MNQIPERLAHVQERIHRAAMAAGRSPGEIMLLAVSKTKPASDVAAAFGAGQRAFGENYLQDALPKIRTLADKDIEWHFIGRLQSNKCADISRHFTWVHGIDSLKHAEQLSSHRPAELPPLQVCIQVNLSGEVTKGGVDPTEVEALALKVARLPRLRLRGLMTMPDPNARTTSRDAAFAGLRGLLESLRASGLDVDTLSMGMSDDMEAAIREGATIVRIGTDIFGPRD
ncbi:MAG TPA: YggS family pyridoxal phosphate-dependent enzyme [Gammaproteobacteria bacterium]|nr:YggS family pyridoxal phosphate-dependent enzyme [Chromatiaceae bacterium]MCP5440238.1 YggS family pyridoxal phosphate-dependent enzyme [Chromatiaceae bacterium]HPE79260.1 YggS family pyridoxal phosphate-dependent enzyme [Gammaproteobacteria bacterium]